MLVSALAPPSVSRAIQQVQRAAGFAQPHAQWHHAAVYVGHGLVCEALITGARANSLWKYCSGTHRLLFRRDERLSDLESCHVALHAALKLKYRYSWGSILQLLLQARTGWGHGPSPRPLSARATICSQLFADAYGLVSKRTLAPAATAGVAPAHLAADTALLQDVPMQWLALPPG